MRNFGLRVRFALRLVALLAALGTVGAPAAAQQPQQQPRPAPASPQQRPPQVPVPPPGAGAREGQVFQDWIVRCERIEGQPPTERCFMSQIQTAEGGQRLISVAIGYLGPAKEVVGVVHLPLGFYLPAGAALRVDEGPQLTIQVQVCLPEGCRSVFGIDSGLLASLRSGQTVRFGFLSEQNGQSVLIPVSLKGFGAGFATLRP